MTARSHRSRGVLRGCRIALALVAAGALLEAGPARAADDPASTSSSATAAASGVPLGGYQGSAAADGLHARYNLGDVLPLPPPVDLGAPDALATIAAGPTTFARASVADPGDLLANPSTVLALLSPGAPSLPAYPFRVSASSGSGAPTAEVAPAPGLDAKVSATATGSVAVATTPAVQAPAIATFGAASSTATTTTDGSTVTVHAHSELGKLEIVGVLSIDAVTTDLTATSAGHGTTLTGGTRVTGATLLGQPITIDADGVHASPGSTAALAGIVGPLTDGLNGLLRQIGIHVTVDGPVKLSGAGAGQLATDGLRIDVELSNKTVPALTTLLDALPPIPPLVPGLPSVADVLQVAKANHLASIEIGSGVVSLDAQPGYEATTDDLGTDGGGGLDGLGTTGSFDLPGPGSSFDAPTLPSTPGATVGPRLVSGPPKLPVETGLGSLVLLALISLPFIGDRLAAAAATILATDPTDACPLEEP